MKYIEITLPIPPSVNIAFAGYPKRHKSQEYKNWEKIVELEIKKYPNYEITGDNWLGIEYNYFIPLFYKNGKKKIQDLFNYEKILTDFLTHNIKGFEDHKIKYGILQKHDSQNNIVKVKIWELK